MSNKNLSQAQNNFGLMLRQLRKERGLTLDELSKKIGISYGYVGQIERGTKQPEPLVKEKIEAWMATGETPKFDLASVPRPLTPEEGQLLKAFDDDPIMGMMVKDMLQLDEADRAQAYADFRRKWKAGK